MQRDAIKPKQDSHPARSARLARSVCGRPETKALGYESKHGLEKESNDETSHTKYPKKSFLSPSSVFLSHPLKAVVVSDLPLHVVWDFYDLEVGGAPVRIFA